MKNPGDCSQQALEALEGRVLRSLAGEGDAGLSVLGHGEVTTVLALDEGQARYAVKRLPLFLDHAEAARHADAIDRYVAGLAGRGVRVLPTRSRLIDRDDGRCVLYLVQPRLDKRVLGPGYFRAADERAARSAFGRVVDALARATDATLAPDGQLSNWAFVDDELWYLDVSTPFMRKHDGSLDLDWSFFVRSMPPLLRSITRHEIPKVVARYCDLRHQVLDFLANLKKERLQQLIPPLLQELEGRFDDRPITADKIDRYYRQDARAYSAMQSMRRGHRWLTQRLLRRSYPVLLPPPLDRGL